jgi:hypothetical protein
LEGIAAASPPAGTALETWNGVTAYVQGGYCAPVYARSGSDAGYSPPGVETDSCGFQCVELAVRYFRFNEGISAGWNVGTAIEMCDSYPAGVTPVAAPSPGDLMVYNPNDSFYGTGYAGHVAVIRSVNADGTLNVFNQNWADESTAFVDNIIPWGHAACFLHSTNNTANNNTLSLKQGQSLTSSDGRFTLIMQSDGNLVLYAGARPLWATGTNGKGGYTTDMQGDGNFVVYTAAHSPLWASRTDGHPGAYLVVQNDGNVVIYDPGNRPLWATNTVQPTCSADEQYASAYNGAYYWTCDLNGDAGRFICDDNGNKTHQDCAGYCVSEPVAVDDMCSGSGLQ